MKKYYIIFMLIVLTLFLPLNFITKCHAEKIDNVKIGNAYIPENTTINLKLLDNLSSDTNHKFDIVNFTLNNDIIINNIIIIPKDTFLSGIITKIHGSRMFGQGAIIRVKLNDYTLKNGKTIRFTDEVKIKGGKNYANLVASVVVPFSGLLFKGKEIDLSSGTIIDYELNDNLDLGFSQKELKNLQ